MYRRTGSNEPASAEEFFNQLFDHVSYLFNIIGCNALDPGYRINRRTVCSVVLALFTNFQVLYFLWCQRSSMIQFLAIFPYMSFATQGTHPMALILVKPSNFSLLKMKSSELFDLFNENVSNRSILAKPLRLGIMIQKLITTLYSANVVFLLVMPLLAWLFFGEHILVLLFRLPTVDESTTGGFLATIALHATILFPAFCGFAGIDCLFLAVFAPVVAFTNAIANEIDELNQLLELSKDRQTCPVQLKLNRIIKLHQLLIQYIQMLEDHYNIMIFVKVGGFLSGMISSILVLFSIQQPMAFIFFIVLLVQLTQYCLLGTILNTKNEQLIDHLYDFKWYLLPHDQAKILTLMLARAQNAPNLTVGKFTVLDFKCYDEIMRKIYSLVMLLASFLK